MSGIAVAALLVYVSASLIDWDVALSAAHASDPKWLALSAATTILALILRASRWWMLADGTLVTLPQFWSATAVGYLGNFLMPLRLGEVLRVLVLIRIGTTSASQATISSILDRTTDVLLVSLLMILVAVTIPLPKSYAGAKLAAEIVVLLTIVGSILALRSKARIETQGTLLRLAPGKIRRLIGSFLLSTIEVVSRASRKSPVAILILLTSIALLDIAGMWFVIRAIGWDLPISAALTFTVFLTFGSLLPSTPGYIGIYQFAAILSFGLYGIDATNAVAYSLLIQATTAASFTAAGCLGLAALLPRLLGLRTMAAKQEDSTHHRKTG